MYLVKCLLSLNTGIRGLNLLCTTLLAVAAESGCGLLLQQLMEGQVLCMLLSVADRSSQGSTVKENAEFARKGVRSDIRGSIDCCRKGGLGVRMVECLRSSGQGKTSLMWSCCL